MERIGCGEAGNGECASEEDGGLGGRVGVKRVEGGRGLEFRGR